MVGLFVRVNVVRVAAKALPFQPQIVIVASEVIKYVEVKKNGNVVDAMMSFGRCR